MEDSLKIILWQQFGASVDMLENAIVACPETLWDTTSQFWYLSYHTLFYLDYYSSEPNDFLPPDPFTLAELDPKGIMPDKVYDKEELLKYLRYGRNKAYHLIMGLNDENSEDRFINEYRNYNRVEIVLYNMRHVQHHVGQLNVQLRQFTNSAPGWVSQAGFP